MVVDPLQLDLLKAQDLQDWQDHIAWEEIIAPEMKKVREILISRLVALNLGQEIKGTTREMVAGQLFGMDWIEKEISKILGRGRTAEKILSTTPV